MAGKRKSTRGKSKTAKKTAKKQKVAKKTSSRGRGRPPKAAEEKPKTKAQLVQEEREAEFKDRQAGWLLSFGSGDISQLGLGHADNMIERKFPTVLPAFDGNAVAFSCGSLHNAVITSEGDVWTWGCNDDAALGHGEDEWLPAKVTGGDMEGKFITKVECGASHTVALASDGTVLSWGTYRDGSGVIGFNAGDRQLMKEPALNKELKNIVDIAVGDSISVAIDRTGTIFQWGDLGNGQRTSSRQKGTRLQPRRVVLKKNKNYPKGRIVRVFAGGYTSFALDENGRLYVWGPNNYGQCGVESDEGTLWVVYPTMIESLADQRVVSVAAGLHHSIVCTEEGKVYTFGRGSSGRLGQGDEDDRKVPTLLAELSNLDDDKVVSVCAGDAHTGALTEKNQLYMFGNGDLLQIGNGEEEDVLKPHHVQGKQLKTLQRRVLAADGGSQHSMILTTEAKEPVEGASDPKKDEWVVVDSETPADQTVQPPAADDDDDDDELPEVDAADAAMVEGSDDDLPEPTADDLGAM